jgi:hypothetical protein
MEARKLVTFYDTKEIILLSISAGFLLLFKLLMNPSLNSPAASSL